MATKSDFMAAEEIKAILHGRDKIEQERIIRWVTESLGLVGSPSILAATPMPPAGVGTISPANAPSFGVPTQRSKDIKTFIKARFLP